MARNLGDILPFFIWGDSGEKLTPEQAEKRRQVAQSLLERATDTRPDAGGWASVINKGLMGWRAGRESRLVDEGIKLAEQENQSLLNRMLNGDMGPAYPEPVAQGASPTSGVATGTEVPSPVAIPSAPEIRQGLIDRGLPPHIADAFILNFQDESGLNPGINEKNPIVPGSRGGFGLYQLTGPRRREYEAFAAQRGVDPADVNAQLDFLMKELHGSEAEAAKSILSAPDTATAAQAIVNNFLRPAPEHRQARAAKYARVATTPQEAIEQVAPIEHGDESPYSPVAPNGYVDPLVTVANSPAPSQTPSNFNDRWNAGAAMNPIVPERATPVSANIVPEVYTMAATRAASSADPRLLELNDKMLGGALSPAVRSPVAEALTGYFPDAPRGDVPFQAQQASQAQMRPSNALGINPAILQAMSSPYASEGTKHVAAMLLKQTLGEREAMRQREQAMRQREQAMQQRAALAQSMGIDPSLAMNADDVTWKAIVDQKYRDDPASIKEYQYAVKQGYPGSYVDFQLEKQRAGASNTNVSVAGSNAWEAENAKLFAKRYDAITSQAANSNEMLAMIDLAEGALNSGVRTGLGADAELTLRQFGKAIGLNVDDEKLSGAEMIRAIQNRMSLIMRSPDAGMGMPGALSDRDIKFLKDSQIGIDKSPEGNRRMIKAFRALEMRKVEIARMADDYVMEHGRLDAGFNKLVREYAANNPLFADVEAEVNTPAQSDSGGWRDMGGGIRIRPKGSN